MGPAEIGTMLSSLAAASEIAKAMVGIRDATLLQTKAFELTREIVAAQQGALATQAAQFALLDKISQLEKEVARLEHWDSEKERYELQDVYFGCFAHALKPDRAASEPPHWICSACYQRGRKQILQPHPIPEGRRTGWRCPDCKSDFITHGSVRPGKPFVPA